MDKAGHVATFQLKVRIGAILMNFCKIITLLIILVHNFPIIIIMATEILKNYGIS